LIAWLLAAALGGCRAKQPMHLSIQDTWTQRERTEILHDMDRWQVATNHLVQYIASPTPFHDPDGFDRADLDDGVNVIYKIEPSDPGADWLNQSTGEDLLGYNFDTADIVIFRYKIGDIGPTVTHELGHHLGLGHIRTHPAIMNDLDQEICITNWDLEAFCEIYDCRAENMHPECTKPP
jgi:hypothetical protein